MFSWFLTKNGRIFTHFSLGIATATSFAVPIFVHGPLLDKYQSIVQLYENEKPKPLDPDVIEVAEKALNDCKIDESEKKKIKFFNANGKDIIHAGGRNSPWGAIIGIPFVFEGKRKRVFTNLRFVGMGDSDDWLFECPELIDTFRLPEEARKFAIAREIYSADINRVIENALIASFFIFFFPAITCKQSNYKYNLYKLPFKKRFGFYSIVYGIGFLMYKCLKNPTLHLHDKKCDEKVAELGPEYIDGGIKFYENLLAQNKELRKLFKKRGESAFTATGDYNYFIFPPKLPISRRLEYFQNIKSEISKP